MSNFIINGGKKLSGKIKTNSAKNSAVAILCATAMIKGKTSLVNMPVIEEVKRVIEILVSLGISARWTGKHELEIINPWNLNSDNINRESFIKTRSGLLLMGALLSQQDKFTLPNASGCKLGKRTVSPYTIALEHLGIEVSCSDDHYEINKKNIKSNEFTMYETSDTATENTIMAAALAPGKTIIHFASFNYMVQDLCVFLEQAGAKIKGIGTQTLKITGVNKLKPVKDYPIMPDPIESMAFISIAITTKSELKITHCPIDFLRLELEKLRLMGQKFNINKPYKSDNKYFNLVDIIIKPSQLSALPDKLHPLPYPGLNIDNLPLFIPILTQTKGTSLVHDWIYENRAIYYTELNKLGADITLLDQHRVSVFGPSELKESEIICPPALRPSINLLICMLAAKGRSILRNSYSIDRGYEDIVTRLNKLGADIKATEKLNF
ncbi:UDP-N-acetylglucosamine 1-carboxyvinyltransferase [Candidatus Parcubacteria bacterium]|nr:UDP-N-acetylglucosamine 1-carboxyvinyltransferase [Candidatus Parcubacteria bacterium]